jgi:hypothetical protein
VAGWGALLKTTNGGTTFVEEKENKSYTEKFFLSQNFPNPFNSSTKIRFFVYKEELVTIKLYDILGREISTVLEENKVPGEYEIEINSDNLNLSSGIYFYLMKAGEKQSMRKLLLLK